MRTLRSTRTLLSILTQAWCPKFNLVAQDRKGRPRLLDSTYADLQVHYMRYVPIRTLGTRVYVVHSRTRLLNHTEPGSVVPNDKAAIADHHATCDNTVEVIFKSHPPRCTAAHLLAEWYS